MTSPYRQYLEEKARASNQELRELNDLMADRPQYSFSEPEHLRPYVLGQESNVSGLASPARRTAAPTATSSSMLDASTSLDFNAGDYLRPLGGSLPQGNSRAVIGALKALQEKIRKLEGEKNYYADNYMSSEKEKESIKRMLELEKSTVEQQHLRVEADLATEKGRMEAQLGSTEARVRVLENELSYMTDAMQKTEEARRREEIEKLKAATQIMQTTEELNRVKSMAENERLAKIQLEEAQIRAKSEAEGRLVQLEREIEAERQTRHDVELNRNKTEQTLRGVLEINESLLNKVVTSPPKKMERPRARAVSRPPVMKRKAPRKKTSRKPERRKSVGQKLPWVSTKSTAPSFSVTANVQKALSMLQDHNPHFCAYCQRHDGEPHHHHEHGVGHDPILDNAAVDIQMVIQSLEYEFDNLSRQYRNAVADLQSGDIDEDGLKDVIDAMEAKGEQINSLKRYHRNITRRIHQTDAELDHMRIALESEEALRRAETTPLKVLRGVRELQRSLREEV